MKLSEAIRLGAMMKPQKFGEPNDRIALKHQPTTCALAAAAEAAGDHTLNVFRDWKERWPVTARVRSCPACSVVRVDWLRMDVTSIIAHLNDFHQWTREQIADWVESQEALEAVSAADFAIDPVAEIGTEAITRDKTSVEAIHEPGTRR